MNILWLASWALAAMMAETGYAQGTLERFRLITVDGGVVEGANGVLDGGVFSGTTRAGDRFELQSDRMIQLEQFRGRRTGSGLALGVLSGLAVGVLYMLLEDHDGADAGAVSKTVAVFLGLGAAGGVVGAAIGGATSRWEPVPLGRRRTTGERELGGTVEMVFRF